MIKERYVSPELAEMLREKGFNVPCKTYYYKCSNDELLFSHSERIADFNTGTYRILSAPTLYMAMEWLREKGMVFEHIYNDTDSIQDINAWVMFFGEEYVDATYFKPILRPMSNMTEEERQEYGLVLCDELSINQYDWLNAHHFDFRNLIEKGLAIEVTEENNPYK